MVEHAFNSNTAGPRQVVFSELEAILVYTGIPGHPRLHSQTLSKEGRRKKKKRREPGRKKEKKERRGERRKTNYSLTYL